jgi:hypothetical protein
MVILSAILYFITYHPGLTMLAATGIGLGVDALLAMWRQQALWCTLVIPLFLLSAISYFILTFVNAPDLIEDYQQELNKLGQN